MKKIIWMIMMTGVVFACKNEVKEKAEEAPHQQGEIMLNQEQIETINLKTEMVQQRKMENVVKTIGYFHVPPKYQASVSAIMGGYITRSDLLVGDFVKKGQLLCTIKNPDFIDLQQQFMQAANQIKSLRSSYERQKNLYEDSISSEKELLQAEADYKNMLASYQAGKQKLLMLNLSPARVEEGNFYSGIPVLAPVAGYIAENNTSIGQYVSPAEKLLRIIDKSHLHLELAVHERDAMKIKKGQKVKFSVPSLGQELHEAKIFLVGKSLKSEDRTIVVHAHLINEKAGLEFVTGMYLDAEIIVNDQHIASIPEEAVMKSGEKSFIFVKEKEENDTTFFTRVEVNTTSSNNGYIGIAPLIKLPENAEIVIHGAYYLLSIVDGN